MVKKNSANSVTTVFSETLENRPNISVLTSLQGSAPGVIMYAGSSSPGSGKFSLMIRGTSSISSHLDPLYVIDGYISNSSEFRKLNSNDIESVSVLKRCRLQRLFMETEVQMEL